MNKRREPNAWLIDQEFLLNSEFFDLYYLQTLSRAIWNYLINVPIPVLSTWDKTNKRIYLSVGDQKYYFNVDINIAYDDFITLIDEYLRQFFPKYEIEYDIEVDYSDEEIIEIVEKEKINLNDAILRKKKVIHKEVGMIEKVFMKEDQFVLNVDGKKSLYISGTIHSPKPLRIFLAEIRSIKDNYEIKQYILFNSVFVEFIPDKQKDIEIPYTGRMLFNFVKINYNQLKEYNFIKKKDRIWKWKNYIFKVDSDILESDIFKFFSEQGFNKVVE